MWGHLPSGDLDQLQRNQALILKKAGPSPLTMAFPALAGQTLLPVNGKASRSVHGCSHINSNSPVST